MFIPYFLFRFFNVLFDDINNQLPKISTYLILLFGIIAFLLTPEMFNYARFGTNNINPIALGSILFPLILISSYGIFNLKYSKIFIFFSISITIFGMYIVVGTGSRGIIYSFFIALLLHSCIANKKWISIKTTISAVSLFLIFYMVITNFQIFNNSENLLYRYTASSDSQSMIERYNFYNVAYNMFIENPLLGQGSGSFQAHSNGAYVHNIILENLSSFGVFGTLFLVLWFLAVLIIYKRSSVSSSLSSFLLFMFLISIIVKLSSFSFVHYKDIAIWSALLINVSLYYRRVVA
ncbi:O-antigen ligase family protein [Photobacterium phosphoreum]|uniref:O-antigen ligase family protein n=1 Tax=Photobacterium phosphoreum TaxID=659 RepID=UPI0015E67822|nr:O-antigen ligase family protein [Photobacterium phosphoreum]